WKVTFVGMNAASLTVAAAEALVPRRSGEPENEYQSSSPPPNCGASSARLPASVSEPTENPNSSWSETQAESSTGSLNSPRLNFTNAEITFMTRWRSVAGMLGSGG